MSQQKFVVSHMDKQIGPYTESELKSLWGKGEVLPIDYVFDEVQRDWVLMTERFAWTRAQEIIHPPPARKASPTNDQTQKVAVDMSMEMTQKLPVQAEEGLLPPVAPKARQTTKVNMVNGLGEIALSNLPAGSLELSLANSSVGIKLQEPYRIEVRAAEPHAVNWSVPSKMTAGQELVIDIRVVDQNGQLCLNHSEKFSLQIRGPINRDITFFTQKGQASAKVAHTTAETWTVALVHEGKGNLKLPSPEKVEWHPGPPVRLILDGHHEYIAGSPVLLKVKAVDAYGNVAKDFQGSVTLEVKAG